MDKHSKKDPVNNSGDLSVENMWKKEPFFFQLLHKDQIAALFTIRVHLKLLHFT